MKTRHLLIPVALILMTLSAHAAPFTWSVDPPHTGIYFDIKHIFSTIRGQFDDFSIALNIDPANIPNSSCSFTVQTDSINTLNATRDTHLKSDEFFDTKAFPTMTFKSTQITAQGGNRYLVEGDLTIHGVTKRITVPFTFLGIKPNPMKSSQVVSGFNANFAINRLDFNVGNGKYYKMGVVDKEVDITISVEALK